MEVRIQKKKEKISIELEGRYLTDSYITIVQHLAEIEFDSKTSVEIDCSKCTSEAYQLQFLMLVLAKHFSSGKTLKVILSPNQKDKGLRFEPVWSQLVKE
ncbi:hypothetical protein EP331_13635 [bacterium]|nr:MAG: hypothetical protein EP331_13635 [bacterium]